MGERKEVGALAGSRRFEAACLSAHGQTGLAMRLASWRNSPVNARQQPQAHPAALRMRWSAVPPTWRRIAPPAVPAGHACSEGDRPGKVLKDHSIKAYAGAAWRQHSQSKQVLWRVPALQQPQPQCSSEHPHTPAESSPAPELRHRVANHSQAAPDARQRVCHARQAAAGKVVVHPLEQDRQASGLLQSRRGRCKGMRKLSLVTPTPGRARNERRWCVWREAEAS